MNGIATLSNRWKKYDVLVSRYVYWCTSKKNFFLWKWLMGGKLDNFAKFAKYSHLLSNKSNAGETPLH